MVSDNSISAVMTRYHRECDDLFADAEAAASKNEWEQAQHKLEAFINLMEHHLHMEEDILFPAFEEITHHMPGPTQVMLIEHLQMRKLFQELSEHANSQSCDDFLGTSETLMMLMQQHNIKEEQILYAMMDDKLDDNREELLQQMAAAD